MYSLETLPDLGRGGEGSKGRSGEEERRACAGEEGLYFEGAPRLDLWEQGKQQPRQWRPAQPRW